MHLPVPADLDWQKPVMFYGKPLTFNPKSHRYTWDGRHVPSVTTILRRLDKPQLVQWAANCAVDHIKAHIESAGTVFEALAVLDEARKAHTVIRDTAGDVGTQVHEIARTILAGGTPTIPFEKMTPAAHKAVLAFDQWRSQHRIQPIALERRVMSAELMYAGTCDFYGIIDDEPCLLDFKTGNGVYDEAWYQLAGYEVALMEEFNREPGLVAHWIVHLNKTTGECKTYRRNPDETKEARGVWEHLVRLDKAIRAMPKEGSVMDIAKLLLELDDVLAFGPDNISRLHLYALCKQSVAAIRELQAEVARSHHDAHAHFLIQLADGLKTLGARMQGHA